MSAVSTSILTPPKRECEWWLSTDSPSRPIASDVAFRVPAFTTIFQLRNISQQQLLRRYTDAELNSSSKSWLTGLDQLQLGHKRFGHIRTFKGPYGSLHCNGAQKPHKIYRQMSQLECTRSSNKKHVPEEMVQLCISPGRRKPTLGRQSVARCCSRTR